MKLLGQPIRHEFPFFKENPTTIFLDSAASSLKPTPVIEAIKKYYDCYSVNIHRGVYKASMEASEIYESTRTKVANFIGSKNGNEIVYTRNATEGFNLLSYTLPYSYSLSKIPYLTAWKEPFQKGDVILISESEHHANIVPWQILAERFALEIVYIPIIKSTGELCLERFEHIKKTLTNRTLKIVSLSWVSNVTGIIHDLKPFSTYAREKGSLFIVDGAQGVCCLPTNVQELDADFFIFSGHKMLAPTGIGVLWGKYELLNLLSPFMGGGDMILNVTKEKTIYAQAPHRFEAGTPHIAGVFGLSAAIDYLQNIGMQNIYNYEKPIIEYAIEQLEKNGHTIFGPNLQQLQSKKIRKTGAISFGVNGIHPHDIGTILDKDNIAIRVGHHCCQILMNTWEVAATCRASIYLYNTKEDIDALILSLAKAKSIFGV